MQALQDSGVDIILWLQSFSGPLLDTFFSTVSHFGGLGYLLIIPLLLYCVEPRLGLRTIVAMLLAQYVVMLLKDIVQEPRPFIFDSRVLSDGEHGFSFPSGHAMGSMVFYGLIFLWTRKVWLKGLLAALIFFVGVSRSYLGVHFPHDVATGWLLGLLSILAWPWLEKNVFARLEQSPPATQSACILLLPLVIATAHYYIFAYTGAMYLAGGLSVAMYAYLRDLRIPAQPLPSDISLRAVTLQVLAYALAITSVFVALFLFGKIYPPQENIFYNVFAWLHGALIATVLVDLVPWLLQKKPFVVSRV